MINTKKRNLFLAIVLSSIMFLFIREPGFINLVLYMFYEYSGITENTIINNGFYLIISISICVIIYKFFNSWSFTRPSPPDPSKN